MRDSNSEALTVLREIRGLSSLIRQHVCLFTYIDFSPIPSVLHCLLQSLLDLFITELMSVLKLSSYRFWPFGLSLLFHGILLIVIVGKLSGLCLLSTKQGPRVGNYLVFLLYIAWFEVSN